MSTAPERLAAAPARRPSRTRDPRHLRVVGQARRPRRRRLTRTVAACGVAAVVVAMFAVATCQAMLVEGQLRLDRLERRVADEQARYERNRLRVAELESPERIVTVARDELGMVPPDEVVYLTPDEPAAGVEGGLPAGSHAAASDVEAGWEDVKPYLETSP
jgi:cell division protein FtsL